MDTQAIFLTFGISLAVFAVATGVIGLTFKNFPNRIQMVAFFAVGICLVAGTATFGVKLQQKEQKEREEGKKPVGEEANVTPLRIPADLA